MNEKITVQKRDGLTEPFDAEKLRQSLKEANAPDDLIEEIIEEIISKSAEETSSDFIYSRAFDLLKEKRRSYAARYSLRQSVADLGPTGYPFEKFVARIFEAMDYETTVGVDMQGSCTNHEVDVVAESDGKLILIEAKFHNSRSIKSAVQTPLYVQARFQDLEANDYGRFDEDGKEIEHWLVTNTKFSRHAVEYGECVGMHMVGWGYPETGNLEDLITKTDLQPVTALTSLSGSHKRELTEQGVVMCKTLREQRDKLAALGFDKQKIAEVMEEVDHLCHV